MPRNIRELRTDLRRAGFFLHRTRGTHTLWKHPLLPGIDANIAGKDGADVKPYQEDEVRLALAALRAARGRNGYA
jgi:predicted RNA binding protein YcfA (HicA-like mRNA interferase family)